jgi:splicing suppressor protein 51
MLRLRPVLRPAVNRIVLRPCRVPSNRFLFNFAPKGAAQESSQSQTPEHFHLLSQSPHKDLRIRAERVKRLASCPICLKIQGSKQRVAHECANCGWPTHCSHEHWEMDDEHRSFCGKLREVNEDEHDLRSGRALREFALPGAFLSQGNPNEVLLTCMAGPIGYDETVSFSNWDIFWYTRGFPSVDDDRAGRHLSKLLTYPLSIAGVIHEHSSLTTRHQRLTPEGLRSLVGELTLPTSA